MKKNCLLILCVLAYACVNAQINVSDSITIKGRVVNSENKSIPHATITVDRRNAIADGNGLYSIKIYKTGKIRVQASSVGYENISKNITVKAGEIKSLNFILMPSDDILQTVEITGRKERGYQNATTFLGSKVATADKDIPQSMSFITKELMLDQGETRVGDLVKNLPGVNQHSFYDDIVIRGFRINGGASSTQLFNGLRTITGFWKQSITSYLERVEVLKGPSSVLYGNASPGGVLNRVTKKPLTEKRYSVNFSVGSFNTIRANADLTGPANRSKTILYRLNLGYENAQNFRDLQYDKGYIIAPSLSFLPTPKTRINLDLVINQSNSRLDRGQAVLPGEDNIYAVSIERSLSMVNDYLNETNLMFTASLNHKFTENFQFNMGYLKTGWSEDLLEHRVANARAKDSSNNNIPHLIAMQVFIRKRSIYADNFSNYFSWDVATGNVKHRIIWGYDYAQTRTPWGGSQLTASGYRNPSNTASQNYNAKKPQNYQYVIIDGIKQPVPNVPHFDLTAENPYELRDINKYIFSVRDFDPNFYNINGVYINDQVSVGKFKAVFGLRYDYYYDKLNYLKKEEETVKQGALIPRIGLVFEATKNINLYASWVKGYNPQSAGVINNPLAGGPFDPEYSQLWEGGAKGSWFNNRFSANAAVYRIARQNVLVDANVEDQPELRVQIGEMLSKGFEFGAAGSILPNWSLTTAYGFNEIFFSKSTDSLELNARRPNAPKHQGNIWTKYSIPRGAFSGIGFGGGFNFVSKRLSNKLDEPIPAYSVANAAVYYRFDHFQIQLNIKNVFNKRYWVGGYDYLRMFPGAPRSWLATVSYTF